MVGIYPKLKKRRYYLCQDLMEWDLVVWGPRTGRGMGPCSRGSYERGFYGSGYRRGTGRFRGLTPRPFGPEEEKTFFRR